MSHSIATAAAQAGQAPACPSPQSEDRLSGLGLMQLAALHLFIDAVDAALEGHDDCDYCHWCADLYGMRWAAELHLSIVGEYEHDGDLDFPKELAGRLRAVVEEAKVPKSPLRLAMEAAEAETKEREAAESQAADTPAAVDAAELPRAAARPYWLP